MAKKRIGTGRQAEVKRVRAGIKVLIKAGKLEETTIGPHTVFYLKAMDLVEQLEKDKKKDDLTIFEGLALSVCTRELGLRQYHIVGGWAIVMDPGEVEKFKTK